MTDNGAPGSGDGVNQNERREQTTTAADPSIGSPTLGNYRLLRQLGEGGMGIVYEAEQQNPKRAVALKVIRGGRYVSERDVKLFEREAQALASLKHPSIAAIYEAGRTEAGQHFFAMELVRGVRLVAYARSQDGTPAALVRQRLELFRDVCSAVSYAHQRGVIHRDLKPSNILVSPGTRPRGDGSTSPAAPDVKILDFGLARITDPDGDGNSINTDLGAVAGTLPYMSPEQARGNSDEIDLRTDVYSLGVILYELLIGRLPYDVSTVSLPEAVRVICNEPPQRPRQLWVDPRRSGSGRVARLDEDLVTIILKALEKESARRYQSAAALAEDIERYLRNEPILARRASATYQVRKLVSRHKAGVAFASALLLLLAASVVMMTVQSARTARERDRALAAEATARAEAETAKRVSQFLVDIFKVSDPSESRGNAVTARAILDRGATRVSEELKDQPVVQATLMDTMGRVYHGLGLFEQSRRLLETGLTIRRRVLEAGHPDVATSLANLGDLLREQGDYDGAEQLLREALAARRKIFGDVHTDVAFSLARLGRVLHLKGDFEQAEPLLREALAMKLKILGDGHLEVADNRDLLASTLTYRGNFAEAEGLYKKALDDRRRQLGTPHREVGESLNNLGALYHFTRDFENALTYFREALEVHRTVLGEDHPDVAVSKGNVAAVLTLQGKYDEAEPLTREVVELDRRHLGEDHPLFAMSLGNLGRLLTRAGKAREAEPIFQNALRIQRKTFSDGHWEVAVTLSSLGECLTALRRYEAAEALLLQAWPTVQSQLGAGHRESTGVLRNIINLYEAWGKPQKAAEFRAQVPKLAQKS